MITDESTRPPAGSTAEFFYDKNHGIKIGKIAKWIVDGGLPMSRPSVLAAMHALGIDHLGARTEREIHGVVSVLRAA